jgi:hypothetical protein
MYNKTMFLSGKEDDLLGPSYKPKEDENVLLMESMAQIQDQPEETEPILGEVLPVARRKGGKY